MCVADYSNSAIPTQIDVDRDSGVMIWGSFGNGGSCAISNQLYVKRDHPQYKEIYATALAAMLGKYRIRAYVHGCEPVLWYSAAENTFNVVYSYATLSIAE